jgi:hypothetical protein
MQRPIAVHFWVPERRSARALALQARHLSFSLAQVPFALLHCVRLICFVLSHMLGSALAPARFRSIVLRAFERSDGVTEVDWATTTRSVDAGSALAVPVSTTPAKAAASRTVVVRIMMVSRKFLVQRNR